MAFYRIENELDLGMSHSGAVVIDGESTVELTDEDVEILVNLIREKHSTNVRKLGIEAMYPELYEKLDDAYRQLAYDTRRPIGCGMAIIMVITAMIVMTSSAIVKPIVDSISNMMSPTSLMMTTSLMTNFLRTLKIRLSNTGLMIMYTASATRMPETSSIIT